MSTPSLQRLRQALLVSALLLLACSTSSCGGKEEKPVPVNRAPPPSEITAPEACPDETPVPPEFKSDVERLAWAWQAILEGRLCRVGFHTIAKWALNPPKGK